MNFIFPCSLGPGCIKIPPPCKAKKKRKQAAFFTLTVPHIRKICTLASGITATRHETAWMNAHKKRAEKFSPNFLF
jgi:hypothetical protein